MEPLGYKNAIIYALDVKLFFDSDSNGNGDGTGDLAGILQQLLTLKIETDIHPYSPIASMATLPGSSVCLMPCKRPHPYSGEPNTHRITAMDQATRIAVSRDIVIDAMPPAQTPDKPLTRSTDNPLRFRRVSGRSGLMSIDRVWRRVIAQRPTVQHYQTYEWYKVYLDALEYRENDWHFFIVYQDYTPVGIVPLRQTPRTVHGVQLQALELPDHPHVPFADLILPALPTRAFAASFMNYLRHSGLSWDALILRRIPADSATLRLFAAGTSLACVTTSHWRLFSCAQANEVKKEGCGPEALAQLGGLEYATCRGKPALDAAFAIFLRLDASGWRGHPGLRGAIRDDSRLVRYYRRLIDVFADGACEIRLLKLNGEPIAAQFCLLSNEARYVLKTGYDAAYAHLAPARALLDASMRQPASDDHGRCLISAVPWLDADSSSRATVDIHRFNTTRNGLSAFAMMRAAQILQPAYADYRRLRRAMRGRLRDSIAQASRAMEQHLRCP